MGVFLLLVLFSWLQLGRLQPEGESWAVDEAHTEDHRRNLASTAAGCVKWGNTFDVPLTSKHVARPCKLPDGRAICCSAVTPPSGDYFSKPIGNNYSPFSPHSRRYRGEEEGASSSSSSSSTGDRNTDDTCTLQKVYISSPQELRDLAMADHISTLSSDHTDPARFKALMDYVLHPETLSNSTKWLNRVSLHMGLEAVPRDLLTRDDYEYLSRFEVTRTCGGRVERWIEWIEPITIHARHPFSFGACRPVRPLLQSDTPRTGRSNVDYVLLQSGKALFDQSYSSATGRRLRYGPSSSSSTVTTGTSSTSTSTSTATRRQRNQPVRHYMLDAGTSTFDSSLFWFTCAFAQVHTRPVSSLVVNLSSLTYLCSLFCVHCSMCSAKSVSTGCTPGK